VIRWEGKEGGRVTKMSPCSVQERGSLKGRGTARHVAQEGKKNVAKGGRRYLLGRRREKEKNGRLKPGCCAFIFLFFRNRPGRKERTPKGKGVKAAIAPLF